jgi:hypothetical protein
MTCTNFACLTGSIFWVLYTLAFPRYQGGVSLFERRRSRALGPSLGGWARLLPQSSTEIMVSVYITASMFVCAGSDERAPYRLVWETFLQRHGQRHFSPIPGPTFPYILASLGPCPRYIMAGVRQRGTSQRSMVDFVYVNALGAFLFAYCPSLSYKSWRSRGQGWSGPRHLFRASSCRSHCFVHILNFMSFSFKKLQ